MPNAHSHVSVTHSAVYVVLLKSTNEQVEQHNVNDFISLQEILSEEQTPRSWDLLQKLIERSDGQEINYILRNPKVHYRARESPIPVPILSQINPIHTTQTYFPKIEFNVFPLSTPSSSEWSLSFRVSNQMLHAFLNSAMRVICRAHLILLDLIILIICNNHIEVSSVLIQTDLWVNSPY
jgi:hypothetical protein